jgi:hypothetical protein
VLQRRRMLLEIRLGMTADDVRHLQTGAVHGGRC